MSIINQGRWIILSRARSHQRYRIICFVALYHQTLVGHNKRSSCTYVTAQTLLDRRNQTSRLVRSLKVGSATVSLCVREDAWAIQFVCCICQSLSSEDWSLNSNTKTDGGSGGAVSDTRKFSSRCLTPTDRHPSRVVYKTPSCNVWVDSISSPSNCQWNAPSTSNVNLSFESHGTQTATCSQLQWRTETCSGDFPESSPGRIRKVNTANLDK